MRKSESPFAELQAFPVQRLRDAEPVMSRAEEPPSPLGSLVHRPRIWRRHEVSFASVRAWRSDCKRADLLLLKQHKAAPTTGLVGHAAAEVAQVLQRLLGSCAGWSVTSVPCGHSRRSDCFGRRLAEAVAALCGVPYVQTWADRFCSGSSHPKEFAKLPPLQELTPPTRPLIVVDDVATSGWHMEEALTFVRSRGISCFGVAWIGGELA